MNERIQELAEQAGFYYTDKTGFITPAGCDPAEFAKLIIEDCLDILDDEDGGDFEDRNIRIAAIRIKQHFGVK